MSARVTPRSASATTSLMRRQFARTPQECSMPQSLCVQAAFGHAERAFHRLDDLDQRDARARRARGDSRRARRGTPATRPACASGLSSLATVVTSRPARSASSAALCTRVGRGGEHGQHDGGVVGEFGDPEHGQAACNNGLKLYGFTGRPAEDRSPLPCSGRAGLGCGISPEAAFSPQQRAWPRPCAAAGGGGRFAFEIRQRRLLPRRQVGRRRFAAGAERLHEAEDRQAVLFAHGAHREVGHRRARVQRRRCSPATARRPCRRAFRRRLAA